MIGEAAGGSSAATSRADYRQQSTTSTLPSLSSFPGDQAFRLLYVALIVSSTFGVLAFGVPPFATRSPLTSHLSPLTRSRRSLYSHCPCVFFMCSLPHCSYNGPIANSSEFAPSVYPLRVFAASGHPSAVRLRSRMPINILCLPPKHPDSTLNN